MFLFCIRFALPKTTTTTGEWIQFLNPKLQAENWYVTHKTTYGSLRWMSTKYYLPLEIISIIIPAATYYVTGTTRISNLVDSVFLVFAIFLVMWVWFKIPQYKDTFLIKVMFLFFPARSSSPLCQPEPYNSFATFTTVPLTKHVFFCHLILHCWMLCHCTSITLLCSTSVCCATMRIH